ncbi:DUF4913 domain-containing protein [Microbacterium arborescens]
MNADDLPLTEASAELVAFVDGTLLDFLAPAGSAETRWCPQWAEHSDAVHRLAAIRDEWNLMLASAANDGVPALHAFLRDVLDYHLPLLIDQQRGAFRGCGYGHKPRVRLDDTKHTRGRADGADTARPAVSP